MWSKKRKKKFFRCALLVSGAAIFILVLCVIISTLWVKKQSPDNNINLPSVNIQKKLLEKNEYSRPGIELKQVNGVVVHYTANPGTDAIENRNYFNNLPKTNIARENKTYASSHFVIGLTGQIIQCVPLNEMSYASNERNSDTISIECCHPSKSGKFNAGTYESLVQLTAYLCLKYSLNESDVIRHYDVTGKNCPKYFVEHEEEWQEFKNKVKNMIAQMKS